MGELKNSIRKKISKRMKFSSLGSGSSGNSSYIEMGSNQFLIDAGFSGKKIVEKLNEINIDDLTARQALDWLYQLKDMVEDV